MKIAFLADLFVKDLPSGGGEKSNDEFCRMARLEGHEVIERNTYLLSLKEVEKLNKNKYFFLIGNFICLESKIKNYIINNCKYAIIEHDHKYLISRNPGLYKNFLAPTEHIINKEFYEKAVAVFCQSKLHKEIIEKNLNLDNICSIGGNFWSDEELKYITEIRKDDKLDIASVVNYSGNASKGTELSIKYCIDNNIKYNLINSTNTKDFLLELSKNKYMVFIPRTPETLSRIVIEAKMLDVKVKTIKGLIGAASEPWFQIESIFLVNFMRENKKVFYNKIMDKIKA